MDHTKSHQLHYIPHITTKVTHWDLCGWKCHLVSPTWNINPTHTAPTDHSNKVVSMISLITSILWLSFLQTRTIWLQTLLKDFVSMEIGAQQCAALGQNTPMIITWALLSPPQWLTKDHYHKIQQAQSWCIHYIWLNSAEKRNHSIIWNWTQCQADDNTSGTGQFVPLDSCLPTEEYKKASEAICS